jgi:hypothetical protein
MKKSSPHCYVFGLLLAGGLAILNFTTAVATAAPEAAPAGVAGKLPAELLLAEIKATPYAGRAALKEKLKAAETRMDDRLPGWEAKKNALPEKERIAADGDFKQLVKQREVLRQKIDGVEYADEATWNSAKSELYVVLQNAITTYKKLQSQFDS